MSKIIGLTGGIGSGKTTVAKKFEEKGFPVYNADERSKNILQTEQIIKEIITVFGKDFLNESGKIDRKKLAQIVFNIPEKLKILNGILHPKVGKDFENWILEHQKYPFLIKEAAILLESGSYKNCDFIILVTANLENRVNRVMKRDNATREEVLERINNQWNDEEKEKFAHFVIVNNKMEELDAQIENIIKKLELSEVV